MNVFEAIFAHDPASIAIHFGERRISYGELRAETLRMVQVVKSHAVNRGDRVALLLHDSPEFVEAFIAIISLGAIAVPINMALRTEEQCSILQNSGASVAFTERDFAHTLLRKNLHALKKIVEIERPQTSTSNDESPAGFPDPAADDPAFILYTSGSTGEPKGAIHTQSDIFYTNQTFCREVLRLTAQDRLFSSSRLPFAYGLGNSFTFPLLNGATTILCCEKPTPDVIARIFSEHRPTIFFGVPVIYNLLLEHHRSKNRLDCSSLRLCV